MDTGALIALISIAGTIALAAVVIAGAWALGRVHERRLALQTSQPEEIAQRLARIEQMVERLSTDVECMLEEKRGDILPRL